MACQLVNETLVWGPHNLTGPHIVSHPRGCETPHQRLTHIPSLYREGCDVRLRLSVQKDMFAPRGRCRSPRIIVVLSRRGLK